MSPLCCDICFEQFNSSSRRPLVICPNGHSVCKMCFRNMRTCPQCRTHCLEKPIPNISLLKTLDNLVNLKVLVVGETGVGKSSLMLRYTDEKFMADILPTVGLDFRVKVMELAGYSVKISIWDTAGQERFKNISSSYYRGAQGVVLVYDITERRTFNNLARWLTELERYGGEKMVKVVVGNKRDQIHKRSVSYDEGKDWADQRGFLFTETSARDRSNVELVFQQLVGSILQEPGMWSEEGGEGGGGIQVLRTQDTRQQDRGGQCCIRVD